MLSLFGFGKKRKSSRKDTKSRKSTKAGKAKKPPAKVLRMCKKLKVKTTVKRGSKRVYNKASLLMKMCKKKLRMLKKHKAALKKKSSRMGARKSGRKPLNAFHRRKSMFGMHSGVYLDGQMGFGAKRKISFGSAMEFGKKRKSTPKVSKADAMKAFKAFYRRHCSSSVRGNRFGNGGNPNLFESMGGEFCQTGDGGVLGNRSTGLFFSPCTPYNAKQAATERAVVLPTRYGGSDKPPMSGFGRRKSRKMAEFGALKRKVGCKSKVSRSRMV
jgi:hypothetical protein